MQQAPGKELTKSAASLSLVASEGPQMVLEEKSCNSTRSNHCISPAASRETSCTFGTTRQRVGKVTRAWGTKAAP